MTNSSEQREAVRNLKTGALVLLTDNNRKNLLNRPDMVSTVAVRAESGRWVDANANEAVGNTVMSNSLERIVDSLLALDAQKAQLVSAALKIDGGAHYLAARGLVAEDDAVAPLPATTTETTTETPTADTSSESRSKKRGKRGRRSEGGGKAADSLEGI